MRLDPASVVRRSRRATLDRCLRCAATAGSVWDCWFHATGDARDVAVALLPSLNGAVVSARRVGAGPGLLPLPQSSIECPGNEWSPPTARGCGSALRRERLLQVAPEVVRMLAANAKPEEAGR